MNKRFRKFVAIISSIAMVVAGITYTPKTVSADAPDWSGISYLGSDSGDQYANKYKWYCATSGVNVVNIQKPGFASGVGIYATFPAGITSCSFGSGNYDVQGAGIIIHLSNFTAQETEFTVTDAQGTYTCYVYYADGTSGGETTTAAETTTEEETTTAVETSYNWVSISNGLGGQPASGDNFYYDSNTFTGANVNDIVNIQESFGTEAGVYARFNSGVSSVVVNGTTQNAQSIQGSGILIYLSLLTEHINTVTVAHANGTTTFYIKNGNVSSGDEIAAPTDVKAYNFYANTGVAAFSEQTGYQVVFTASTAENVDHYNVYMDNSAVLITVTASGTYIPASTFSSYADNNIHTLYLEAVNTGGDKSDKVGTNIRVTTYDATSDPSDISRIYIVTNKGTAGTAGTDIDSLTKATSKMDAAMTIIKGNGALETVSNYGSVKLRGNSTSLADKKAYNITFNKAQTVMSGANAGKKWCLLANAYEKTMMRNKLAMDFGALLGNVAAPEEHYADVYINGTYKGTYVVSEPADNGRAGVEYGTKYSGNANDVLFEYEDNERDESSDGAAYYTTNSTTGYGKRFVCEDFEDDVKSLYKNGTTSIADIRTALYGDGTTKFAKWANTLDAFETAIKADSTLSLDDLSNYIDVDSFIDMYIINELFKTVDFAYSSVKFYVKYDANGENPVIYAGPLWDFDLSSGNTGNSTLRPADSGLHAQENAWFGALMSNENFADAVKTKYQSMQDNIQNLYMDVEINGSQVTSQIDQNYTEMQESRIRNYSTAGWSESTADSYDTFAGTQSWGAYSYSTVSPYNTYTYDQHVQYLKDWFRQRNDYLCRTWDILSDGNSTVSETTLGTVDGSNWHTIGANGWSYKAGSSASYITYAKGTTFADGPIFNRTYASGGWENDFQVKSPVYSITEAGNYDFTLTVNDQVATTGTNTVTLYINDVAYGTTVSGSTSNVTDTTYTISNVSLSANDNVYILLQQSYASAGVKYISANITSSSGETTTEAESTTEEETTTAEWTLVHDKEVNSWDTQGVWHMYAEGDEEKVEGGQMSYNGTAETYKDATFKIVRVGDGDEPYYDTQIGLDIGLTIGKTYDYSITYSTTSAGRMAYTISDNLEIYQDATVGSNTVSGVITLQSKDPHCNGTNKAEQHQVKLLFGGMPVGAQIRVTSITFREHSAIGEKVGDDIAADGTWISTYLPSGSSVFTAPDEIDGSTSATYTLEDEGRLQVGYTWWHIQTIMRNIVFNPGKVYTCTFTITAENPKAFVVDDQTGDSLVFTETDPHAWIDNGDGTWSYNFTGTLDMSEVTAARAADVRISYGYNSGDKNDSTVMSTYKTDTNYETNALLPYVTMTNFHIRVTSGEEEEAEVITADANNLLVEGFQIRTNDPSNSVAFRTVCKAPKVGSTYNYTNKEGAQTSTVASVGTIYAIDIGNKSGDYSKDTIDATYTLLNPNAIVGDEWSYTGLTQVDGNDITYGYISTESKGYLSNWNAEDSDHTYYAFTMQNMDAAMGHTMYVRAFIVLADGTIIYGTKTAVTCVAEIADYLYTNSYADNYGAHTYLYEAILNNENIVNNKFYRSTTLDYGWDANLYVPETTTAAE